MTVLLRKQFRYDEKSMAFTNEIEEIELKEFVRFSLLRLYDYKLQYVSKEDLFTYCKKHGFKTDEQMKKRDLVDTLSDNFNDCEMLKVCDDLGIGVTKYNYLCVMSENEYKKIYKKLKVIGREHIKRGIYKNLYSVREFLDYAAKAEEEKSHE